MKLRNPSSDLPTVFVVRRTKAPTECGLLVPENKKVCACEPDRPIDGERDRTSQQCLAQDDDRDTHIHRIPHVSVEATNDQMTGRVDGRQRAPPTSDKLEDTSGQQYGAQSDARKTEKTRRTE